MKMMFSDYKKENLKFTKISLNIPMPLLAEFDKWCNQNYFSRVEGIKQLMRERFASYKR